MASAPLVESAGFTVHPASHARFADVRTMVGPKNPSSNVCWCLSHRIPAKDKAHPKNHIASGLTFKQAIAVGKFAFVPIEFDQIAGLAVQRCEPSEDILDLDTVCADILNGCRTDRTGYQAEILQPSQTKL